MLLGGFASHGLHKAKFHRIRKSEHYQNVIHLHILQDTVANIGTTNSLIHTYVAVVITKLKNIKTNFGRFMNISPMFS